MQRVTAQIDRQDNIRLTIHDPSESEEEPSVSPEQGNVIRFQPYFVYLDVGRWGGVSDRNFGVIYGDDRLTYVAVCEYVPSGSYLNTLPGVPPEHSSHQVIQTVIGFLNSSGSRVVDGVCIGRMVDTNGRLYFLLGDVHLPVYASGAHRLHRVQCRIDGNYIRYIQNTPDERSALERFAASGIASPLILSGGDIEVRRISTVSGWRINYLNNDIFTVQSSNAPADDLSYLVQQSRLWENGEQGLQGAEGRPRAPIHFIQLGDMYELWVGLRRLFLETSSPSLRLQRPRCVDCEVESEYCPLTSSSTGTVTAEGVIRDWVNCIHQNTTWAVGGSSRATVRLSLAEGLASCGFSHMTWLYGNHDNYLGILHRQLGLPQREPSYSARGIHVEHGHAGDEYNRDGEAGGHAITQCGAFVWNLRPFTNYDFIQNRQRRQFIEYSVRKYIEPSQLFRVFAMAHTHAPYLARVSVRGLLQSW
jgi:hypothetical protein